MPESVNEKITFGPMSGLIFAISVGLNRRISQIFSLVNSKNLASVAEWSRDMVGCPNLCFHHRQSDGR
jgi:hypothetical protein